MKIDKKIIGQTIAKNIQLRLERASLKEEDLADIAGISTEEAAIVYTTGGANGTVLYKIANALNCAVDDFYLGIFDQRDGVRTATSAKPSCQVRNCTFQPIRCLRINERRHAR